MALTPSGLKRLKPSATSRDTGTVRSAGSGTTCVMARPCATAAPMRSTICAASLTDSAMSCAWLPAARVNLTNSALAAVFETMITACGLAFASAFAAAATSVVFFS